MKSRFRYILRYCIDPGYHEDERIEELVRFCRRGRIDEVMLFFGAEELNAGHATREELIPWLALAHRVKTRLAAIGVDLSINPWTTLVHSPRGRHLREGQNFTLMVGENGADNGVTACPLCPEWRRYLTELWQWVAGELRPCAVWVEDDLRYHNHGRALGFGGCYCERHLAEFSHRAGQTVGREELLARVFAPGEPHPWRQIWFDLNHQALAEVLAEVRAAVTAAAPDARIGLMCGHLDVAGCEGRRWPDIADALGAPLLLRPSLSPYTEVWGMRHTPVQARMLLAAVPGELKIYPELETGPRHGAYSKSDRFAGWQILQCAAFGAHGVTMNVFDMLGCGTASAPDFHRTLARLKPRLETLAALGIDDRNAVGANILVHPEIARHMESTRPGHPTGCLNHSGEWGQVTAMLGVAAGFTSRIERGLQPYLVSGQTLAAYDDRALETLLAGPVILDAVAAEYLRKRGFGAEWLGVTGVQRHWHNRSAYSYEEILEDDPAAYGMARPRMTAQRAARQLWEFTLLPETQIHSRICRYDHVSMFPGAFTWRNRRGGTVTVLAYPLGDGGDDEWFYMGFFNPFRRIFLERLLRATAPEMAGAFGGAAPMQISRVRLPEAGEVVAALNPATEATGKVCLRLPQWPYSRLEMLTAQGGWRTVEAWLRRENGGEAEIVLPSGIAPLDGVFLRGW